MKDNKRGLDNTYCQCVRLCPSLTLSVNSAVCVLPTLGSPMLDLDWTKVPVVFSPLSLPNGKRTAVCVFDSGGRYLIFSRLILKAPSRF